MKNALKLYKITSMKFNAFNLDSQLVEILASKGYVEATEVQQIVIPKALRYENIIVRSETGTGKTHSFLIPIFNQIQINKQLQAIILSPSRELARQIYSFAMEIAKSEKYRELSIKLFVSGEDNLKDIKSFSNGCEILIATPGKLKGLLSETEVNLDSIRTFVLDEADMLLDEGFFDTIDGILEKINRNIQIEVYSATISKKVEMFLKKYISPDYVLTNNEQNYTAKTVTHYFINTKHQDKKQLLLKFIELKKPYFLLVFASTKKEVEEIYNFLNSNKIKSGIISGALEARERKSMLRRIKNDEFRVVVCSDLASRGLDIENVSDVLSINLPNNLEYYYHRAGRTGRNYKTGQSYVFYDYDSLDLPTKLLKQGLEVKYLKYANGDFVDDKAPNKEKKHKKELNTELETEIRKVKAINKSKKVKPGYKKKVKQEIQKVKNKHKRESIKKDIRRQRVERYIEESKKSNGR